MYVEWKGDESIRISFGKGIDREAIRRWGSYMRDLSSITCARDISWYARSFVQYRIYFEVTDVPRTLTSQSYSPPSSACALQILGEPEELHRIEIVRVHFAYDFASYWSRGTTRVATRCVCYLMHRNATRRTARGGHRRSRWRIASFSTGLISSRIIHAFIPKSPFRSTVDEIRIAMTIFVRPEMGFREEDLAPTYRFPTKLTSLDLPFLHVFALTSDSFAALRDGEPRQKRPKILGWIT